MNTPNESKRPSAEPCNLFAPDDIVRHVRSGHTYRVLGRCTIEATLADCYMYRSTDGHVWIRPVLEMEDGRFVLLTRKLDAAQPAPKDREKDRERFNDPAFNRWLDEGISDAGHTVYDTVDDLCAAWAAWQAAPYYCAAQPAQAGEAVGLAMIPTRLSVSAETWEAMQFLFGGPGTGDGEAFMDCTLWVGECEDDDGSKIHGLHLSCDECPEEGSITVCEFQENSSPQPEQPASADSLDAWNAMFSDLHPATSCLVWNFAIALGNKLRAAEEKYGYSDGWRSKDWIDECRQHLVEHVAKGDPRDVAAYCAFLWHHGESTAQSPAVSPPSVVAVSELPLNIAVASLIEAARCLGSAQATKDEGAIKHWSKEVESFAQRIAGSGERDAVDAARYRWLRCQGNREHAARLLTDRMNVDEAIDAAIAQQADKRGGA